MDIVLACALVLACASAPLTAWIILRHGGVGATPREMAEKASDVNQEIALRRLKLEEERHEVEIAERRKKIYGQLMQPGPAVRNVERA